MASTPSSSTRVQRKRRERRDRIVEAAYVQIAEAGPADFSLNQIARDLDYTPGALYWYFKSKEALVVEVQRRVFSELAQNIREGRARWSAEADEAGGDATTRSLFATLMQASFYLDLERTAPQHARIIAFSLDPRVWLDDENAASLEPSLGELFTEAAAPFVEAERTEALAPGRAEHRGVQYWAALQGVLLASKLSRIQPTLFAVKALGMNSAQTLLRGWGAPEDALATAIEWADAGETSFSRETLVSRQT